MKRKNEILTVAAICFLLLQGMFATAQVVDTWKEQKMREDWKKAIEENNRYASEKGSAKCFSSPNPIVIRADVGGSLNSYDGFSEGDMAYDISLAIMVNGWGVFGYMPEISITNRSLTEVHNLVSGKELDFNATTLKVHPLQGHYSFGKGILAMDLRAGMFMSYDITNKVKEKKYYDQLDSFFQDHYLHNGGYYDDGKLKEIPETNRFDMGLNIGVSCYCYRFGFLDVSYRHGFCNMIKDIPSKNRTFCVGFSCFL